MVRAAMRNLLVVVGIAACSHNTNSMPMNGVDAAQQAKIDAPVNLVDTPMASGNNYDTDGTTMYTVTPETINANGQTVNATLYMPSTPGKHPLVGISCGSTQTAAGYATYGKRLASYGIAVIIE